MVVLLDPIIRAEIQSEMADQSCIVRIDNPLLLARIPIAADGVIDGVGLAALRCRSHSLMAPRPLWERACAGIAGYFLLRKRTPMPVEE